MERRCCFVAAKVRTAIRIPSVGTWHAMLEPMPEMPALRIRLKGADSRNRGGPPVEDSRARRADGFLIEPLLSKPSAVHGQRKPPNRASLHWAPVLHCVDKEESPGYKYAESDSAPSRRVIKGGCYE